jgi:hypothetical protein
MTTTPPTVTALPTPPNPDDRGTFNSLAYPWTVALGTFTTQVNALGVNVKANADEAAGSATTAGEKATAAETSRSQAAARASEAATSANAASASAAAADADATATAADRVATGADKAATAADRVATASSAAAAAASALDAHAIAESGLPSQAGNAGKVFKTNGTNAFWGDAATVYLSGDKTTYVNQVKTFTITNFNSFSTYAISASHGTASLSGETVTYTAPASAAAATITITMDGAANAFALTVQAAGVATPTITSPTSGATGVFDAPTITSSAFAWAGVSDTHASSDWQLATDAAFGTVVQNSTASTTNKTTWTPTGLTVSTVYYVRVRHRGAANGTSSWSPVVSFTTASAFNSYIATPTATPAIGSTLEGGFYTGMIWNELVQSSTSMAIATGSKTFTVPSMTSTPIVYAGQTLEVRSRANPANKLVGTVTGANGTNLTINVTSVGGSGTFTDWSVMAQYRIIVAPKSSGESASQAYKNANDSAPAACQTLTEGRKATLAMVAAGSSTIYPAAHFCNNLSIGGKTDWYLPARDELELCWRNLKPTTDSNYVGARGDSSLDYKTLGSYDDVTAEQGINLNSSPATGAYTASVPVRTSVTAFQTGGSEAFTYGSDYYWSSSEYNASFAWFQGWSSSLPGYQNNTFKSNSFRVRAVRRSII